MIEYPNKETLKAIEESKDKKNILGPYSSFEEMVNDFKNKTLEKKWKYKGLEKSLKKSVFFTFTHIDTCKNV